MRLDKYLKVSRIIKRRTVANEACAGGRVLFSGKMGGNQLRRDAEPRLEAFGRDPLPARVRAAAAAKADGRGRDAE